jgi:hypothetical protein
MITQAVATARQDLILRELLERPELREICLQVLAELGQDRRQAMPLPVVRDGEPGAEQ